MTIVTDKALGTGFVVESTGVIATNNHVIEGAREVEVKMYNGEVYRGADVLFVDKGRDLALIKITAVDLPTLKLGNSDQVSLGEDVCLQARRLALRTRSRLGLSAGCACVREPGVSRPLPQRVTAVAADHC